MTSDFFNLSAPGTGALPAKAPALQFVRTPCDCGATGGWRQVGHYDVVRCSCGKYYWILQPKRNGPFVAKLYPGIPGLRA